MKILYKDGLEQYLQEKLEIACSKVHKDTEAMLSREKALEFFTHFMPHTFYFDFKKYTALPLQVEGNKEIREYHVPVQGDLQLIEYCLPNQNHFLELDYDNENKQIIFKVELPKYMNNKIEFIIGNFESYKEKLEQHSKNLSYYIERFIIKYIESSKFQEENFEIILKYKLDSLSKKTD